MARLKLFSGAVPAAGTTIGDVVSGIGDVGDLTIQMAFDYGSGGTTCTVYVQTSLDGGTTWHDIAAKQFSAADATRLFDVNAGGSLPDDYTPSDGALASGLTVDGLVGDQLRVKLVTVGTYAASTLSVYAETRTGLSAVPPADTFSNPTNANAIAVGTASTELVPAAAAGVRSRQIIIRIKGTRSVCIKEGAAATTAHFDFQVGEVAKLATLEAVNGIVAAGADGSVGVFVEARS